MKDWIQDDPRLIYKGLMSWNKPFKAHYTDSDGDWLVKKGLTKEPSCGNLKASQDEKLCCGSYLHENRC